MGRILKSNADYFPHDSNASEDIKIRYLESLYAHKGYAFYFKMLEILTNCNNFEADYNEVSKCVLASKIGVSFEEFEAIIKECIRPEVKCFVINNGIIFSPGLKKRFAPLILKREADRNRILAAKINTSLDNHSENTHSKEKKRKEKKSKEKESKETSPRLRSPHSPSEIDDRIQVFREEVHKQMDVYPEEMLNAFFNYWSEPNQSHTKFRKETEKTWDLNRRLVTWANNDKIFKERNNGRPKKHCGKENEFFDIG